MTVESPIKSGLHEVAARPPELFQAAPSLSILVPVAERHDDLRALYRQVAEELDRRGVLYEVIVVLDGPHFSEAERQLRELRGEDSRLRVYRLNRAFGEATALQVAVARARGRTFLTLAPYFQLAPGAIGKVLDALDDGVDLAIARRYPRLDSWFNRLQSWVFHGLINLLTGVRLSDISCGLRAMKAEVLRGIPLYGDLHRFVPLMAYRHGYRIVEVPLPQSPMEPKLRIYGSGVYLRRLLDIVTVFFLFKFTRKPLRFFGLLGGGLFGIGLLITGYLAALRLLQVTALADRPLFVLGVLLMVLGFQTASLGLIGEIIVFTRARDVGECAVERLLD